MISKALKIYLLYFVILQYCSVVYLQQNDQNWTYLTLKDLCTNGLRPNIACFLGFPPLLLILV